MFFRKNWKWLFCVYLLPILGWAYEDQPWLGNYLEFEWTSSLQFQCYKDLSCKSNSKTYLSRDIFLYTQLALAATPQLSLNLGAMAAWTNKQAGSIDHLEFNGRYIFLDDVIGDPVTLTLGINLIHAFPWSLRDPSSFHHGKNEGELFISMGKEWAEKDQWSSRLWAKVGFGSALNDSAWIRLKIAFAQRIRLYHEFEIFSRTLCGFGRRSLNLRHFHGYGSIDHQSVDLGLRYTYLIDFIGNLSVEYAKRIYSQNFPSKANQIQLTFFYPFGL
ncbi:Uncharacterized protein PRO82_000919 [Candidatus Protochlamydia amoebophila]|uniref:hypothetical protein n=1 Tax=Candidatus Protochlamydia amoebophila TaxID=362787 RepID=UPI001BC8E654|nr:hypothetical protein [Candidatus Protochlamydia amoebophila]MBS4163616.1 Uncharacterized protein [Candidatus Protochlamydia amoebophila]